MAENRTDSPLRSLFLQALHLLDCLKKMLLHWRRLRVPDPPEFLKLTSRPLIRMKLSSFAIQSPIVITRRLRAWSSVKSR